MEDIKSQSLGQLQAVYEKQLDALNRQRAEHMQKVVECDREIADRELKLDQIRMLLGEKPLAPVTAAGIPRRARKSPVRTATLQVLRNLSDQRLSVKEIRTLIRKDVGRRVSRQAVNVNLDQLEQAGLVRRYAAPRGTGARFVFGAAHPGGAQDRESEKGGALSSRPAR